MEKDGTVVAVRGLLGSVAGMRVGIGVGPEGRLCGAAQAVNNKIIIEHKIAILYVIFSYSLSGRV
jgi:hypothetical protein